MHFMIIIGLWGFVNSFQVVYFLMDGKTMDAAAVLLLTTFAAITTAQLRKGE